MSKIIVPLDFSSTSFNALEYAKNLAHQLNYELQLVHYYPLQINAYTTPEGMIPLDVLDNIKDEAEQRMQKIVSVIEQEEKYTVSYLVEAGDVVPELSKLAEETNPEFIIMGTVGNQTVLNKLIGSNAAGIVQNIMTPIILIPADYELKPIQKIVYADSFDKEEFAILEDIINLLHQLSINEIDVLHINEEHHIQTIENNVIVNKINHYLGENSAKMNIVTAQNFEAGFNEFAAQNEIDLLIMATHKKSFLERIFTHSNTKTMAMHSKIPLLVYHV